MTTLDNLKKSAKRWLKAIREGDAAALERLRRAYPAAPANPTLRDVQHALARESGAENWKALTALDETIVERFLQFACWDHEIHGKGDHRMADLAAQRLLAKHPEIARHDLYTAIVCGEIDEVARAKPDAIRAAGGARNWTPILYAAYTRFTHPKTIANAISIARLLLDRGANPNDFYPAGDSPYTALVGAAGEGEQDAPRQPYAEALFDLLLERGADPFDKQVLYNTHFSGDMLWWLELVYERTSASPAWKDPEWMMFEMGPYGSGARFILEHAIKRSKLRLAQWALERGANPNSAPATDRRFPKLSLYDVAVLAGERAIADLLLQFGGKATQRELSDEERFAQALARVDRAEVHALLEKHPEYRESPHFMFEAAEHDRVDQLELLLAEGVSIDVRNSLNERPLHHAALAGALNAAKYLVDRGAEIDPREGRYNGAPIGWAAHSDRKAVVDFLSRYSRDIWTLSFRGYPDRVAEILREEPALAKQSDNEGMTPLWWLPDDEEKALRIADMLIANGADPSRRNKNGRTAGDWANSRGLTKLAARLGNRTASPAAAEEPIDDAALERIASTGVTELSLEGSRVTDEGLRHLARMPQLESLNLTGCSITDAGLRVLRDLPNLERLMLMRTPTGDSAIAALRGKPVRFLQVGELVTDAGLALLHDIPAFKEWRGGDVRYGLMSPNADPTFLWLSQSAPLTSLDGLAGLDGLFAFSFFGSRPTRIALPKGLPNLGWLGWTGELCDDDAMREIAAMPGLRMLMCQDAQATDDGFVALSRSQSIEYIWGRRSHKLTRRGFEALSTMPALRGLAVSCMNLDDDALSLLPKFPALRELVPIQVPDEGFRHIGRCENLESLWCMYCNDTGDVATEHIAHLRLKLYYAGSTRITDRSLEILSRMDSLERIELHRCEKITEAGIETLKRLPRLRELVVE